MNVLFNDLYSRDNHNIAQNQEDSIFLDQQDGGAFTYGGSGSGALKEGRHETSAPNGVEDVGNLHGHDLQDKSTSLLPQSQ